MDLQKMLEKLALSAQEALQSAMSIAGEAKAGMVEPIHCLPRCSHLASIISMP